MCPPECCSFKQEQQERSLDTLSHSTGDVCSGGPEQEQNNQLFVFCQTGGRKIKEPLRKKSDQTGFVSLGLPISTAAGRLQLRIYFDSRCRVRHGGRERVSWGKGAPTCRVRASQDHTPQCQTNERPGNLTDGGSPAVRSGLSSSVQLRL